MACPTPTLRLAPPLHTRSKAPQPRVRPPPPLPPCRRRLSLSAGRGSTGSAATAGFTTWTSAPRAWSRRPSSGPPPPLLLLFECCFCNVVEFFVSGKALRGRPGSAGTSARCAPRSGWTGGRCRGTTRTASGARSRAPLLAPPRRSPRAALGAARAPLCPRARKIGKSTLHLWVMRIQNTARHLPTRPGPRRTPRRRSRRPRQRR